MNAMTPEFVSERRKQFPALSRKHDGEPVVFLDGPAGTQVPQRVIQAMTRYLSECNANHGGEFGTSRESDGWLDTAQEAFAEFVGAKAPDEIAFGQNMTSLTFALSRALATTWEAGDEILVTRLDHDANVTPWVRAASDAGAVVKFVELHEADCTLDMNDFYAKLGPKTKLVAVGAASNSVGTINPLREMTRAAHQHDALVFVDAVHFAPHQRMDVANWGCDFLACSTYKFFGPHLGLVWGRRELLESLPAYKVRPAPDSLPGKWMTGTQSHESIVGGLAAIDYLADIGRELAGESDLSRPDSWDVAFKAIHDYEQGLARQFLDGIASLSSYRVWGINESQRIDERVATFSITHDRIKAVELARQLGEMGVYAWHGHYYALQLSEVLGREPDGMLRLGFLHYNLPVEVERTLAALKAIHEA